MHRFPDAAVQERTGVTACPPPEGLSRTATRPVMARAWCDGIAVSALGFLRYGTLHGGRYDQTHLNMRNY
jgi:hypothetical protein